MPKLTEYSGSSPMSGRGWVNGSGIRAELDVLVLGARYSAPTPGPLPLRRR